MVDGMHTKPAQRQLSKRPGAWCGKYLILVFSPLLLVLSAPDNPTRAATATSTPILSKTATSTPLRSNILPTPKMGAATSTPTIRQEAASSTQLIIKPRIKPVDTKKPAEHLPKKETSENLTTATTRTPTIKPEVNASKTMILAKLAAAKKSDRNGELAKLVMDARFKPIPDLIKAAGHSYLGDLDEIRKRKVLRVLVTYSRLDFFFDNGQIHGIQAGFFREFVKQLNTGIEDPTQRIRLIFLPVTFDQLIPSLAAGLGDVAAAFLSDTPARSRQVDFASGDIVSIKEIVVSHASAGKIEYLGDLAGKSIYVLRNSSYKEHLEILNQVLGQHNLPLIRIVEVDATMLSEDILELVNAGIFPITVADQYRAELWAKIMPNLNLHKEILIRKSRKAGWAIRKQSPLLKAALNEFIAQQGKGKLLGNILLGEYVTNPRWIKNPNAKSERARLNKYLPLFQKYGQKYGIDELALTALAYQESGLKHASQSPRGAIGIMQVMPDTAADKNVNIQSIDKLEQNIHASAKYLAFLRDHYYADPDLSENDRQAFIWASYNAGPAKVKSMRELTQQMGLDPDVWFGNVELAAGRLVGRETVDYVANVQKYYIAYQLADELQARKQQAFNTASTLSSAM